MNYSVQIGAAQANARARYSSRRERSRPPVFAQGIPVKGFNIPHLYYNHGIQAENFILGIIKYIEEGALKIDEVKLCAPRSDEIRIAEIEEIQTGEVKRVLLIPQRLLELDPELRGTDVNNPPFTLIAKAAVLSRTDSRKALARIKLAEVYEGNGFYASTLTEKLYASLGMLTPEEESAIAMAIGLAPSGSAEYPGSVSRAFEKLEHPSVKLELLKKAIVDTLDYLLRDRVFILLEDFETILISQNVLKEKDRGILIPIIKMFRRIGYRNKYSPLGREFEIIDMTERGNPTSFRAPKKLCISKIFDMEKDETCYTTVLLEYFREKGEPSVAKVWTFAEYQRHIKEKFGISVTVPELRLMFTTYGFKIEGDLFYYGAKDAMGIHLIEQQIKASGPLHKDAIAAATGLDKSKIRYAVLGEDRFVIVGNGIYGLAEDYPELKDVPRPVRGVKKVSAFGAVYGVLKATGGILTVAEIHREMVKRGYKWGRQSVYQILHRQVLKDFFVRVDNKFGIKSESH